MKAISVATFVVFSAFCADADRASPPQNSSSVSSSRKPDAGDGAVVSSDVQAPPLAEPQYSPPLEFPKAHPLVERALETMDTEMHAMRGQEDDAEKEHGRFERSVNDAASKMNDIPHMRNEIAQKEVDLRTQEQRLQRLETEQERLQRSHKGLTARLHAVLDPKIEASEARVVEQRKKLAQMDQDLLQWKAALDKSRQDTLAKLAEKRSDLEGLHEAEHALAVAQRRQQEAQALYDASRHSADQNVEVFRYVQTNYDAILDKEKVRAEKTNMQERSVKNLRGVLNMEEERIKDSYASGTERLERRIERAKARFWSSNQKLAFEKTQFAEWRASERKRVQEAAARKVDYEAAATAYATKRQTVLENAEAQAAHRAERAGDWAWDDWAWSGGGSNAADGGDEVDLED